VWSLPAKPKQRMRAELLNTCTAWIDTNTLTTFTLLLVIRTQRSWSSPELCSSLNDKVGCIAKSSQQSFFHWWQNIHYHLTNLQNHITSNIFDVVKNNHIKTTNFLSPIQSWFANFQKNCTPIQSWSGQNWLQSWSSPELCSSLPAAQFIFNTPRRRGGLEAVVCLKGGERGTCLGRPFLGAPLRCYTRKFSLFLMKNLFFTHIMYYKADHK